MISAVTDASINLVICPYPRYKSKYVHEYLATGLAPETVHDFYTQRFRWAAGGLQIFKYHNALTKRGLNLKQSE